MPPRPAPITITSSSRRLAMAAQITVTEASRSLTLVPRRGDLELERERRAGLGRPAGELLELRRDRAPVEQRIAPVIERDPLREQLGAQPVRCACNRVDPQDDAHATASMYQDG